MVDGDDRRTAAWSVDSLTQVLDIGNRALKVCGIENRRMLNQMITKKQLYFYEICSVN